MTSRTRRRLRLIGPLIGLVGALLVPTIVAAHPLGNFTINHYAGIRVEPDRVLLDVVIDHAEIPTFQARLDFDTDEDGDVSDTEADAGRVTACERLIPSLALAVGGQRVAPSLTEAGLSFPPGAGGLSTMRIVCGFEVDLGTPIAAGTTLTFADTAFPDRLGWREIVVEGSGVTVEPEGGDLRTVAVSARLTAYPTNLLTQALADKSLAVMVSPGGPTLPAVVIADADPLPGVGEVAAASGPPEAAIVPVVPVPSRVPSLQPPCRVA